MESKHDQWRRLIIVSILLSCGRSYAGVSGSRHARSLTAESSSSCMSSTSSRVSHSTPGLYYRVGVVHRYGPCSATANYKKRSGNYNNNIAAAVLEDVLKLEGKRVQHVIDSSKAAEEEDETTSPVKSGQSLGTGNYVMTVGLGSPARDLQLVIDTGSDLAWTQCKPCSGAASCYSQLDPVFDPAASSTYKSVACNTTLCGALDISSCRAKAYCEYGVQYLDGSFTVGDLGTDALSLGGQVVAPEFSFGCGHNNQGLFQGFDGLIGLSQNAPFSFIAQTKSLFHQAFAYCLPPPFSTAAGFIQFGTTAAAAGETASTTTPLVSSSGIKVYLVRLASASIAGSSTAGVISAAASPTVIVDSGTVITRLDSPFYAKLRDAFRKAAAAAPFSFKSAAYADAGQGLFDTCYDFGAGSGGPGAHVPSVTFEFSGGLSFTPVADGLLYPVDKSGGTYCFAFAAIDSGSGISILGNYQQQGFLFSFDIGKATLGINPKAC